MFFSVLQRLCHLSSFFDQCKLCFACAFRFQFYLDPWCGLDLGLGLRIRFPLLYQPLVWQCRRRSKDEATLCFQVLVWNARVQRLATRKGRLDKNWTLVVAVGDDNSTVNVVAPGQNLRDWDKKLEVVRVFMRFFPHTLKKQGRLRLRRARSLPTHIEKRIKCSKHLGMVPSAIQSFATFQALELRMFQSDVREHNFGRKSERHNQVF